MTRQIRNIATFALMEPNLPFYSNKFLSQQAPSTSFCHQSWGKKKG
jgi:hypothetical protein